LDLNDGPGYDHTNFRCVVRGVNVDCHWKG